MLEVVLNIFSGRPNPQWVLTPSQERKFLDLIDQASTPTDKKPPGVSPRLGYRGFTVQSAPDSYEEGVSLLIQDSIIDFGQLSPNRIADTDLERWLLETAGEQISNKVRTEVANELSKTYPGPQAAIQVQPPIQCPICQAYDAPAYHPAIWNHPRATRRRNNCYNYANNQITNTYAQPGYAHGVFPVNIECDDYRDAAIADGLAACVGFANPLAQNHGWYVALVVWPGVDYHWYRQDDDGCWSHKVDRQYATNLDNAGNLIADPQVCDRGPYVNFCTFMITHVGVVIGGPLGH
jgi:hypothetical protein